ncbi:MAG TPA: rhodanese-like domain-containing protein [Candidatus Aquicultor sp.]
MLDIKKILTALIIVASIIIAAGCSSNQPSSQDQNGQVGQTGTEQTASQAQQQAQTNYRDVDAAQAKQLIDSDKTLQLIDVREQDEYAGGHIEGAKLIPIGELSTRMSEIDKAKPVLVYCLSGVRSAQAAQVLVQSGYPKVYNLASGIDGWSYPLAK